MVTYLSKEAIAVNFKSYNSQISIILPFIIFPSTSLLLGIYHYISSFSKSQAYYIIKFY